MTLEELRARIDELDERLVDLLNARAACALEIGRLKEALGLAVYQPEREAEVLRHIQHHATSAGGPLSGDALTRVFERIIDEGRRLEPASPTETSRDRHRGPGDTDPDTGVGDPARNRLS